MTEFILQSLLDIKVYPVVTILHMCFWITPNGKVTKYIIWLPGRLGSCHNDYSYCVYSMWTSLFKWMQSCDNRLFNKYYLDDRKYKAYIKLEVLKTHAISLTFSGECSGKNWLWLIKVNSIILPTNKFNVTEKRVVSLFNYTPAERSWRGGILDSPCPSVRPSVCRRHGFRSISQVCFGISISNFICMLMVAIGKSLLIFSDVTFKMAAWRPYWIFWFPDSNFTLALNINFKLQRHNTYIYG